MHLQMQYKMKREKRGSALAVVHAVEILLEIVVLVILLVAHPDLRVIVQITIIVHTIHIIITITDIIIVIKRESE